MYAPNDHNETYFDNLKDIILDIQAGYPTYPIILIGDFNITMEDRDSANRNVTQNEMNLRSRMSYANSMP